MRHVDELRATLKTIQKINAKKSVFSKVACNLAKSAKRIVADKFRQSYSSGKMAVAV